MRLNTVQTTEETRTKRILSFDPLDDGKSLVETVDYMGDDLMVANAARVSLEVWHEKFTIEGKVGNDAKMLKYMAHHEPVPHWSPFAHPQIQLRIKVPIFVARQWTRSNVGTTRNEMSRRYVDSHPELYLVENGEWRERPEASIKQGSGGTKEISSLTHKFYEKHMEEALKLYTYLIRDENVAPEQAREVLPQNMYTMWIETGSLWYWYGFYRQRIDAHAQKEIREYAAAVNAIMTGLFPFAWQVCVEREGVLKRKLLEEFAGRLNPNTSRLNDAEVQRVIFEMVGY